MTSIRRMMGRLMLGGWLMMAGVGWPESSSVFAQNPAPAGDATPRSGVVTTSSTSNYFVEYAMVILMFGGALFAVCRSSQRNV